MRHLFSLLLLPCLLLLACDAPAEDVAPRDGTSGVCDAPVEMPLPPTDKCECDDEADCGPGTDCVPVEGKGRCLAPYSDIFCVLRGQGWDGITIPGVYPLQTEGDLGPAYCPVCQTCTPPPAGFLVCQ